MATTTLGVKLDDPTRERLKAAATSIDRTPHWLIKQAIFNYLEKLEGGATLTCSMRRTRLTGRQTRLITWCTAPRPPNTTRRVIRRLMLRV